jgi:CheY-like chemotaxis protein
MSCGHSDSPSTSRTIAATRSPARGPIAIAVILVDFELPDADGIILICRLREQPEIYKTPIVIISGDRVGAKEEGSKLNVFKVGRDVG